MLVPLRVLIALVWLSALSVVSVAAQESNNDLPLRFIEVSVDKPNPYVGEVVIYTANYYESGFWEGGEQYPRFNGFTVQEAVGDTQVRRRIGNRLYSIYTYQWIVYPLYPGRFVIEPFQVQRDDGAVVESESLLVDVQALPEGAPESFNGAVGQFSMTVSINRDRVATSEPFTLEVLIEGSGNLQQLVAPALDLPDGWRAFPERTRSNFPTPRIGNKTFSWQIVPMTSGAHELGPILFSFFDPLDNSYKTRASQPLSLIVEGASAVTVREAQPTLTPLPTPTQAAALVEGLRPSADMARREPSAPPMSFWAFWLVPPAVAGVSWLGVALVRRPEERPRPASQGRGKRGQRRQSRRLRSALREAVALPPAQAHQRAGEIVYAYFSRKAGVKVTRANLDEVMQSLPDQLRQAVWQCVHQAEGGQYAPVTGDDARALLNTVRGVLEQVDRLWKPT